MFNCFEVLGIPRAAALDEKFLQAAYAERSRVAHPDHGGSEEAAAALNAAYETLRSPEKRLKHLLDLEAPAEAKAWRSVPLDDSMMELFAELGQALVVSAKFLEQKRKAQTALAKALLANEEMHHRESLERIGMEIERRKTEMEDQLATLDEAIELPEDGAWKRLAEMQARFAYLAKWQTQVRERLLMLM